ncbi:MAG: hypothetical protein OCD02_20825 [Spirochaetaceae bacterium]
MTITIDKKRIDFSLDNEKKLNEVIESLNTWLSESQLIIEKLYINNEDYSLKDLEISLDDINVIDIETLSFKDLNIHNISWVKYFFERLIKAITTWDSVILKQVKTEIPFMITHIPTLLSLDNIKPENIHSKNITEILEKYNYFNCKEEIVDKEYVIQYFKNIIVLLNERLNEYNNAKEELITSIDVLVSFKEELESVATYLQSGKEDKAAIIMTKFTNIFHKILRLLNFNLKNNEIVNDNNLNEFTEGLDEILIELLEGYESQDIVLIGDILEYELSPRIETLKKIFS